MAVTANPHGSWSERNIADIAECLDIAFANVLEFEFGRLTAGMSRSQIDDWLGRSERSIQRLRKSSDMPDYSDCMVVLRYVIPYQLSHINLAYTVIKDSENGSSLTNAGAMRMVDFGAGCLAMSFAVALAVADALDRGERIRAVHLDSIDINCPMMDLGVKLWNEFVHVVSNQQKWSG